MSKAMKRWPKKIRGGQTLTDAKRGGLYTGEVIGDDPGHKPFTVWVYSGAPEDEWYFSGGSVPDECEPVWVKEGGE